jgi:hypothetical protein
MDRALNWTFTKVFSLGGDSSGGFTFFRRSVGADGQGNIYVLDRGNHRVVVFDSKGAHVRTLGREGNGPGELGLPVAFTVTPSGVVSVYDVARHGLVNFAPDGSILAGERVNVSYIGGLIARSSKLLAVTVSELGPAPGTTMERVLAVRSVDTLEYVRLIKPGPTPVTLRSCGIQLRDMPPFFQPSLLWALRDSIVVASTSSEYAIDVVSGGRVAASYRRAVQPLAATLELAVAEAGEGMRVGNRLCEAWDMAQQVGYAPVIPVIVDLRVAPDGNIWVKRYTRFGEASQIDIIAESGEYLGTLSPGSPYPAAFLPGDRVIVEEVDELGVEKVTVYAIGSF